MDDGSDQTTYSEEDDEYDESNTDDGGSDIENTVNFMPKRELNGRRRNVTTRLDRGNEHDNNTYRMRSKWKKYHYQSVTRAMPIQEEDEETAGPSQTINEPLSDISCTNLYKQTKFNDNKKHVIIHVNEFQFDDDDEDDDDELSFDEEICFDKKSACESDSLLVAYDSNSVSSV